jgi:hypothetical protein
MKGGTNVYQAVLECLLCLAAVGYIYLPRLNYSWRGRADAGRCGNV